MNNMTKHIKFWSRELLGLFGVSAGISLVMLFFIDVCTRPVDGTAGILRMIFIRYPFYLFWVGGFMALAWIMGFVQYYFPLLLSMNATRKSIVWGFMITGAVIVAALTAIIYIFWRMAPGDAVFGGVRVIPILGSAFLIAEAFFMVVAAMGIRWGKMFTVLGIVIGAAAGFCFAMTMSWSRGTEGFLNVLLGMNDWLWAAVAAGVYATAGIFVRTITRKMEVKR